MTTQITYLPDVYPVVGGEMVDWPIVDSVAGFGMTFPLEVVSTTDPRALEGTSLMVVATLTDQGSEVAIPYEPFMGGETDWPVPGQFSVIGATSKRWIAANVGITTAPDDEPANTPIPGNLVGTLNFRSSLFSDVDPLLNQSRSESGYGSLRILDAAGDLDYLSELSLDGGLIEVYRGRAEEYRRTWTRVAAMTSQGILYDGDTKDIRLRDASWKLDKSELQPNRYGGGGGLDGDPVLRGTVRPYGVGYVNRAPLLIINALTLTGQVSYSSIHSVDSVEDGGQPLTPAPTPDYPDYATLIAATVPSGRYATCLALGLVRLGSQPTKQVTVSFIGDNDTVNGKTRPMTRADIVRRIACGLGTFRLDNSLELDTKAFVDLADYFTDELGYFWNEPTTKMEAISEVMAGIAGYAAVRFDGRLTVGPAALPNGLPYLTLNYPASIRRVPRLMSYSPPRLATYVGWGRNYTPQSRDQLQGGVPEATALLYSQDLRAEASVSGANASIWPTSQIVTVNGGFRYQAAAIVEATRQQSIFGTRRERWSVEVPMDQYFNGLGRQADVVGWYRYGFAGRKSFRVVGISANDAQNLVLELWG